MHLGLLLEVCRRLVSMGWGYCLGNTRTVSISGLRCLLVRYIRVEERGCPDAIVGARSLFVVLYEYWVRA